MSVDRAGNNFNNARNLGTFRNRTRSIRQVFTRDNPRDFYRLTIARASYVVLSLTNMNRNADFATFDRDRNFIAEFDNPDNENEVAFGATEPGTYYIRVLPATNRRTRYRLTIHSVILPNNFPGTNRGRTRTAQRSSLAAQFEERFGDSFSRSLSNQPARNPQNESDRQTLGSRSRSAGWKDAPFNAFGSSRSDRLNVQQDAPFFSAWQ